MEVPCVWNSISIDFEFINLWNLSIDEDDIYKLFVATFTKKHVELLAIKRLITGIFKSYIVYWQ